MEDSNRISYKTEEVVYDLRQILDVLKKRRNLIIAVTLLCGFAAGLVSYFILSPVYQAKTLLMVTQAADKVQANPTTQTDSANLDNLDNVSRLPVLTMNTYLGQLKSEVLMNRIIKKMRLDPKQYNDITLPDMINAQVIEDSNLIQIDVNNTNPILASRIANNLCNEYLKILTEKNEEQMSRSVAFLEKQKKLNDEELNKAEEKLRQFMSQTSDAAALQRESAQIQADAAIANSNLRNTGVEIHQLNSDVNTIKQQLASTPQFVDVEQLDGSSGTIIKTQQPNPAYAALSQQLTEKKATLAEKQGQYAALNTRVKQLNGQLSQLNSGQTNPASRQLEQDKLQGEVDRLKKISETLAQKGTETKISKSIDLGNTSVQVISEASIPTVPVKPNKVLNIAIALVAGLMITTFLAFILEYLDNTLKTSEDITRELQLPVLAMIPIITKENSH